MKKGRRFWLMATAAVIALLGARPLGAQTVQMQGMVSDPSRELASYGDLSAAQSLSLQISFKPRNPGQLDTLIAAQQDPQSPLYRQWLSSEEFTRRFGPTEQEFDKVSRWLTQEGFQITGGSPSEGVIRFNGDAQTVFRAFNTHITKFSPDGARFGNISEPEIPSEYADLVGTIGGLDNLRASIPMAHRPEVPRLAAASFGAKLMASLGFGPSFSPLPPPSPTELASVGTVPEVIVDAKGPALGPSDFDVFYNANPLRDQGISGAAGCITIVGDSSFFSPAVAAFNTQFGLPDNSGSIVPILNSGFPGNDDTEMLLDLEWSHAVAPGAGLKFAAANDIVDALRAAVNDNSCSVISISFSLCGGSPSLFTGTIHGIAQKAATQGQTILVASGDFGAAGVTFDPSSGCVPGTSAHVNELASDPLITSVGGTAFDKSAFNGPNAAITAHVTERVWNDRNDGSKVAMTGASGGGVSAFFAKPSFQQGVTPGGNNRDQPDVALIASPFFPGSFFFFDNNGDPVLGIVGGTSISTPMWAGIVKLLEQRAGKRVGTINPRIYQIASAGQSQAGFYDVTMGRNNFGQVTGFSAAPGYDLATGWGTVNIANFVAAFVKEAVVTVPAIVTIKPAALNFGNTKVGKQKRKTAKLRNTAAKKGGPAVTFSGGTISGSSAFSLSTTCTGAVAPRKKCTATVQFAPTAAGVVSATVTIDSNAQNGPHKFSVSGNGVVPKHK